MSERPVLVDTDVWGHLVWSRRNPPPHVEDWRRLLVGKTVVISAQTEAELLFGAHRANWGQAHLSQHRELLCRTPTLPVTQAVITEHARLRANCSTVGHALAQKIHMGDAWVAATAIAYGLPLLAVDAIYHDVPGLSLLTDE